jgi:D-3-phosphoglycerate dehydrogenase
MPADASRVSSTATGAATATADPIIRAAAGIDVFEEEPTSMDNPLFNLPNVVVSSHVAGVTQEARRQTSMQVAGEMLRVLRGERPAVLVNPEVWPRVAGAR